MWHHHGSDTPTSPRAILLHSSLLRYIKLWDTLYMVCLVKPSHRCFGHRHFSGWKTSSSKEFSNDEIGQRLARVLLAVARDNHHLLHHGRLYCRGQRWGSPLQGQGSLCTLLNHQQQQVFVASDLQVRYQNNFFGSRSMKYWMYVGKSWPVWL